MVRAPVNHDVLTDMICKKELVIRQFIEVVQMLVSLIALECGRIYVVRMSLDVAGPDVAT